jgi:hypothetical protein
MNINSRNKVIAGIKPKNNKFSALASLNVIVSQEWPYQHLHVSNKHKLEMELINDYKLKSGSFTKLF